MRPTTRMMLANRSRGTGGYETRNNYPGDTQNRNRDGDYSPQNNYDPMSNYDQEPSNRFRDRRGREHYDNGRFAPMRGGLEIEGDVVFNRLPPVYNPDPRYRYNGDERMIGFAAGGYPVGMTMPHDELAARRMHNQHGHAEGRDRPMDRQTAQMWVQGMQNADGSTGEHWTFEQTSQIMRQKGITNCDPVEFYATMNMLWSDYCRIAQKTGQDNPEYWSEMAKAFLSDKDAKHNKLALYYECIVK